MPETRWHIHLRPAMPAWYRQGACAGMDPALFYPEVGETALEARETCEGCLVRVECAEWAILSGEKFGIWGGLTERDRRRIRSRRNREKISA